MRFGIVVFPGSNCDEDAFHAAKDLFGQEAEYLWHKDADLKGADVVILPGGFAHGDYLRTGAMARFSPIMPAVRAFAERGGPVLGICNGFQILLESGLLPGAMLRNRGLKYRCEHVFVRVEQTDTPFTGSAAAGQVLKIPIGHGEGNYFAPPDLVERIEANRQVVLRYSDPGGRIADEWNPNGSVNAIAGICNDQRNVVGMMPHPERACEALLGGVDGRAIFESIVTAFRSAQSLALHGAAISGSRSASVSGEPRSASPPQIEREPLGERS
jgi:phosphoribosylformylglycinamidine synthase subunit PurQ / glutaminase